MSRSTPTRPPPGFGTRLAALGVWYTMGRAFSFRLKGVPSIEKCLHAKSAKSLQRRALHLQDVNSCL